MMALLPFTVRLTLLTSFCGLIFSGFALAGAAFTRDSGLMALGAGFFLLIAASAALLIGRQIGQLVREPDPSGSEVPVFESVKAEATDMFAGLPGLSEPSFADEDTLRRTQKAQALERLRDGIAHDLNNRLMVISANIDAVARQAKDRPGLQRKLLSALVASDQAARLIAKSTAFARQHESQVQYLDLAERVSSVAALMSRSLLRDTVELRLSLADGLWPIEADPDDVETAIVTLSAHLRDTLAPGGTIAIEAQNVGVQRGALPNLRLEGDFVRLSIRGSGRSEAPREAPNLGEQAFSLEDMDLSSWLTLSQGLHFLRGLGGASEVRRNGQETTISLYLPRAKAPALLPSGSRSGDDGPEADVRGHTEILVVDDEIEVALALQSMLEEFGYVTSIATDAGQAMKTLSVRKPGLMLADVTMRGTMDGAMLAREVRRIFPDLPIVLITGNPVVADEHSEFPLLQKPIVSRDLHAAIQHHLAPPDENKIVPLFPRPTRNTH
jgi:CheY-like chemotaxis protein